jgi:hypothetical protein
MYVCMYSTVLQLDVAFDLSPPTFRGWLHGQIGLSISHDHDQVATGRQRKERNKEKEKKWRCS